MPGVQPALVETDSTSSYATSNSGDKQSELSPVRAAHLYALPDWNPGRNSRRVPFIVRVNRALRACLVTLCGLALLGYGVDVATSSEVTKLQNQARRLAEQNTELSAQLLRAISFQGIQASVIGRQGLRVPEQVIIQPEAPAITVKPFKPHKHFLPIAHGY